MFNTIVESDGLKVHFWGDPHLGHNRDFIWGARGYTSAKDHTDSQIDTVNNFVRKDDILIMLGDLCLNSDHTQVNDYLDRIQCRNLVSVWGNHNNPHEKTIYRPERDKLTIYPVQWVYPVKYKNMTYIGHYHEMTVNGQFIVLCHYPFMSWNQLMHGAWMLCGHEHGGLPATRPEASDGKILDLGWDLHKKPLSFAEVKAIMDTKKVSVVGHHVLRKEPAVVANQPV
jgi:calcineurin-like phosphoesterase family protein